MAISFEMNTEILPIVDVGIYDTMIGLITERISDKYINEFNKALMDFAMDVIEHTFSEIVLYDGFFNEHIKITAKEIEEPKYYNYQDNRLSFVLSPSNDWDGSDDEWVEVLIDFCETTSKKENFFEWCADNFGSYDGFISYFPYEKKAFYETLTTVTTESVADFHFSRLFAMVIMYELTHSGKDFPQFRYKNQSYFVIDFDNYVREQGWIKHTEED